jgi:uncharacterized membrane protein YhaH (DUF805 family)
MKQMSPFSWAALPLRKYADFSGRAPRAEYWWFYLALILGYFAAMLLDSATGLNAPGEPSGLITVFFALAMIVPSLAVGARRLHDTGRSGWWLFIALIPLIGALVLLIFFVLPSDPDENEYGLNPYDTGTQGAYA